MSDSNILHQEIKFSLPIVLLTFGLATWSFFTAVSTDDRLTLAMYMILGVLCALVLVNYFAVMITVDAHSLSWQYGFGFLGNGVDRREIEGAFIGRNNHFTGWIFSPFSEKCVIAVTKDGRKIHIPCSDPPGLVGILSRR